MVSLILETFVYHGDPSCIDRSQNTWRRCFKTCVHFRFMCCIMVLYAKNVHPANSRSTWSWRIQLSSHSANKHAAGEANRPCLSCIIAPGLPPPFTEWQVLLILPLNRRHIWLTQITEIISQTPDFSFEFKFLFFTITFLMNTTILSPKNPQRTHNIHKGNGKAAFLMHPWCFSSVSQGVKRVWIFDCAMWRATLCVHSFIFTSRPFYWVLLFAYH